MKKHIKEIVVVEGKTDTNKLQSIFNVNTIETNGLALSKNTINLIKKANKENGIILFLDPDGPGERIRQKIVDSVGSCKNAYIKKTDIANSKKIGVAEAEKQAIINCFEKLVTFDSTKETLSWNDYQELNLDSKIKRKFITDYLEINECNHKRLFKHLNLMNVNIEQLKEIYAKFKSHS
ncbi:MAG: ribonuclease M5 [Mycoplasma sp.]